jgi:LytS/YehU family sensor histidine kinase
MVTGVFGIFSNGDINSFQSGLARDEEQVKQLVFIFLIPVVVAFSFIVFIFYRARREAFFRQRDAELQLKALRAQINPHFIFNSLSSIYNYMPHQPDVDHAREYLEKFSRLIRYVLETSDSQMMPLEDDLNALKRYVALEQLRLEDSFGFEIDLTAVPEYESLNIPPMMIQPFVENSIWHGMNHTDKGFIRIELKYHNDMLRCIIEDNGTRTDRQNISILNGQPVKKTSMGMSLIKDRLRAINRIKKAKAGFIMEQRFNDPEPNAGMRVILDLPFED